MAIELNRDNYEAEVNKQDRVLLVDFWGPLCKPCMALMPAIESLEKEYEGKIKVAKVNAAENRMLCAKIRVIGLPTFILYKDGMETKRLTGEVINISEIKGSVEALLS